MYLAGASIHDVFLHQPAALSEGTAASAGTSWLGLGNIGSAEWSPSTVKGEAEVERDDDATFGRG